MDPSAIHKNEIRPGNSAIRALRSFCLVAMAVLPVSAMAQGGGSKRTCRAVFLDPPAGAPKTLFLYDGTTCQEIELPKKNFSKVYTVAGGDNAVTLLPQPVLKPEEVPTGAPVKKLTPALVDFYMVISSDPKNKVTPVKIQIIDAGSQVFKNGQMMWYNLSEHAIGGKMGSQKLAIKPQDRQIIDAPAAGNEEFDVLLSYLVANDKQFYPMIETRWSQDPRAKMIFFVHGGQNRSTPQVAGFSDFREPPKKNE